MGRKLNALIGRSFKPSKFRALLSLAMSRITILKNQQQVRCSQARSDVVQLLSLGTYQRAQLRVVQVIKEQNRIDLFVMIEDYCILLLERLDLLEQNKECPEELKEAIASLIYAASRCGEFPELLQIRSVFASVYGKEFVSRSNELRNNCGVNLQLIQKLSSKPADLERRTEVLNEIATANGVALQIDHDIGSVKREKEESSNSEDTWRIGEKGKLREYKDVAEAAQAAFESAAYAASAARVAVRLSRSDPGNHGSSDTGEESKLHHLHEEHDYKPSEVADVNLGFRKIHPIEQYKSQADNASHEEQEIQGTKRIDGAERNQKRSTVTRSSLENVEDSRYILISDSKIDFDETDDEREKEDHSAELATPFDHVPTANTNSNLNNGSARAVATVLDMEKRPLSVRTRR